MNKIRTFAISLFILFCGFSEPISAKDTFLQYPIGETVEITITKEGSMKKVGPGGYGGIFTYYHGWSRFLRMEVTLLEDEGKDSFSEVEIIIRDYTSSGMTSSLNRYIGQPLRFQVRNSVGIINASDLLEEMGKGDENYLKNVLQQLFHLKNEPLKIGASFKEPRLYCDCGWVCECCLAEYSFYTITDIAKNAIKGVWDIFGSSGHSITMTMNTEVEWDPSNALIQNRKQIKYVYCQGGEETTDEEEKTEWVSTPL